MTRSLPFGNLLKLKCHASRATQTTKNRAENETSAHLRRVTNGGVVWDTSRVESTRSNHSGIHSNMFYRLRSNPLNKIDARLTGARSASHGATSTTRRLCTPRLTDSHMSTTRRCYSPSNDRTNRPDWDSFGSWESRIQQPILLQQSIKHGIPIPKISIENVGQESLVGRRATNEDRIRVAELAPNLLYFGIYDGHGGSLAADYASDNMERHLMYWLDREHDLQTVLSRAFEDIENQFARYLFMEIKDSSFDNCGTTATVCLLRNGNELVVANVGDSRAILCRKGKAMRLTRDHNPEVKEERDRIKACKGFIRYNSNGKALVNGTLEMTRSIGDESLKRFGVTARPETKSVEVKHGKDSMLVLATDGIILVMTDTEICDSIGQCHDPPTAANFVADQALQFGSEDNASIIVVPFGRWGSSTDTNHTHKLRWFQNRF